MSASSLSGPSDGFRGRRVVRYSEGMPEDDTTATADGEELRQRQRAIWRDFAFGLIVLIGARFDHGRQRKP